MLGIGAKFGERQFKRLLLASSFSMIVEYLLGLSDSIVAGNLLGENSLASINLMQPAMTAVTFIANLIAVGMSVNYSRARGACDERRAHQFFTQAIITAISFATIVLLILSLAREPFMSFMAPEPTIANSALTYWNWYRFAGPIEIVVVTLILAALADGNSRLCFITYFAQLITNASISLLLTMRIGIAGCAIGTLIANLVALTIISTHFLSERNTFRLVKHFSLRDSLTIMFSSFGDSCSFLCSAGLFFFLNKFVIANYGSSMLPVLATIIVTLGFLEIFNGIGTALSPIISVYVGEKNVKAITSMMNYANRWSIGEGAILALFLMVFPQLVARMVGITEPETIACAVLAVRVVAIGLIFYSLVGLYNSYYVFINRPLLASFMTILNGLAVPIALVSAFGQWSSSALWSSLAIAPLMALAIFSTCLISSFGMKIFPYLLERQRADKIGMFAFTLEPTDIVNASKSIAQFMKSHAIDETRSMRAALMLEEVMMTVRDRNAPNQIFGEATIDLNDGVRLTLRDDGEIFDITDSDQTISSLRTYLVASMMRSQQSRRHLITTGFNRNVFDFSGDCEK